MKPPRATYRLQFSKDFGFDAAARIAPYLAQLGISHVYASPYLKARPGSTHGYDIVAHDELNPELGGDAAYARMLEAFSAHGLRQILDFVPNHMGVGGADNPLWLDVLEWGPLSRYARWFDIDWEPDRRYLKEKLLVPLLGGQYGVELDDGKLVLKFDAEKGEFAVWAYDVHKLPICPLEYERILGDEHPQLENLGDEFAALREWQPQMPRRADELKLELAKLVGDDADAHRCVTESLARFNTGQAGVRSDLDDLIQLQYWRATHFRVAGDDINYRRFFNINDLAGLRVELPEVFEHAHRLVFRLLREGALDGLRIDHIDGLLDPKGYLDRLRASAFGPEKPAQAFYLVVEKILSREERLPEDWPIEGATGYEFANLVLGLTIDPSAEESLTRGYVEFTGEQRAFRELVRDCKIRIMKNEMASELNVLARDAARVARQHRRTADFTRNILHRAIKELVACFPVYRTYLNAKGELTEVERGYLAQALARARRQKKEVDSSVFDFLENLLTGQLVAQPRSGFSRQSVLHCAMKLQQYSGPVMAKGLEDTAFYRYNRLVALNEVGGDPDCFGTSLEEFHAANRERARRWPHAMLSTSTHDTKRGEDVRARLAVLSHMPEEWWSQVWNWSGLLRPDGRADSPDRNDEYLLYQLLVGSWPVELLGIDRVPAKDDERRVLLDSFRERIKGAMLKSIREAKLHSTWAAPNAAYEDATMAFIDHVLASSDFLRSFAPTQARVARAAVCNSLVQTTLKLTVPGMPDMYQGTELWDLSLVDPDNRRPVDYELRSRLLAEATRAWQRNQLDAVRSLLDNWRDGSIKLLLAHVLLNFRREHADLFAQGGYEPLTVTGVAAPRIAAFERRREGRAMLVAVAHARWEQGYDSPAGACIELRSEDRSRAWRDLLTGRTYAPMSSLEAEDLFEHLPVAVLVTDS